MRGKRLLSLLLPAALATSPPDALQAQKLVRMPAGLQRDMEILELVLDRLLEVQSAQALHWREPVTRATYLPGFGVLFKVPAPSGNFAFFKWEQEHSDFAGQPEYYSAQTGTPRQNNRAAAAAADEEALVDFFTEWADALEQLGAQEQIAVYREAGPAWSVSLQLGGEPVRQFESRPGELLARVRKPDLDALRAGTLSRAQFRSRIQQQRLPERETALATIAAALERTLANRPGEARSIYLENYGVVFFTNARLGRSFDENFWQDLSAAAQEQSAAFEEFKTASQVMAELKRRMERHAQRMQALVAERRQSWLAEYGRLRVQLAETLADQSRALPRLAPQEWLVIATDLPDAPPDSPGQLICRLRKQDADDFAAHRISREQLLKRVIYSEN
ncbi:MAG: hypothetical protein ONB48_21490 [candidate division KSB1 bacterium]|nr:hypothetical protein [candidate division KSB1 bacterium]MDZ7274855.1 hypothetical protein [candidate division KSB1 bacterium]MDZ7288222.1 hypothetical protein [candidate division KSB1 bacterium]MDZ7300397.1 hypothetical protein [candidate division KSB1 bacterium]MDZ7351397.1 hypothetical protein [candidate division KSB1 bacterium]